MAETKVNVLMVDGLSDVATSGAYSDLTGTPTLGSLAAKSSIANADVDSNAAIDASKLANGSVSNTEFQYLDGVTSSIQTQFSNKQDLDAGLTSIAGLTTSADLMIYTTAADTYTTTALTAAARTLLDDTSTANMRTTLGVGTGDSPQFTAVNVGNASDTTVARTAAGRISVEGNPVILANEIVTSASSGTSYSMNYTNAQNYIISVNNNCTIGITNPPSQGGAIVLQLTMGATPRTVAFSFTIVGGTPDMPEANQSKLYTIVTLNGGTSWVMKEVSSWS